MIRRIERIRRTVVVAALIAIPICVPTSVAAQEAGGRMLQPRLIIHVVASLEKSVAFYKDGLELQVASGPGPLTGSTLLHKALATSPAATARQATLVIPGSNLQLQLIEFTGIEGAR